MIKKITIKIFFGASVLTVVLTYSVFNLFAIDSSSNGGLWKFYGKSPADFQGRIVLVPVVGFKSKMGDVETLSISDFFKQKIIVSEQVHAVLDESLSKGINFKNAPDLYSYLENHPGVVGLVRLSELKPAIRAISVNGIYFYEDKKDYLLTLYSGKFNEGQNDELKRLLTFAQTGVTALTRGIIKKVSETKNPLYLTENIAVFLRQFHVTHTSNEVSFVENCEFIPSTMKFCSPLSYFPVLKACGFDIIELTGNHNNDYDFPAALSTLKLYEDNKMMYFGGGKDLKDAGKILYFDAANETDKISKKKIALIGYNQANVYYKYDLPLAKEKSPGANPFDIGKMKVDISEAKKKANTVIVDFQFAECDAYKPGSNDDCYLPMTKPDQRVVFQTAVDYGADIVVGTQAHQPQVIEKYKNGIIFYGLGNLFFDQVRWEGTRQGMILVHVFFKGEYKNTVVYPTYYDQNLKVRLADKNRKKELLDIYYQRPN